MYKFEARIPFDHAMQLVNNVRTGDFSYGDNLELGGAILGEGGAFLKSMTVDVPFGADEWPDTEVPSTLSGCCDAIENVCPCETSTFAVATPAKDLSNVLLIIEAVTRILELIKKRRNPS
jgi:hypothetical protein